MRHNKATHDDSLCLIDPGCCGCRAVPAGQAQFANAEDAVAYRQSAMFIQNYHMSGLGAMAGNLDTLKTAVSAVGETCKSCHDTFRSK